MVDNISFIPFSTTLSILMISVSLKKEFYELHRADIFVQRVHKGDIPIFEGKENTTLDNYKYRNVGIWLLSCKPKAVVRDPA